MHDTLAMTRLILVEDDAGLRDQLKWALRENFEIQEADSLAAAKALAAEGGAPIVCLDLGLEGRADRGLEVIDAILSADRAAKIIVITGQTDGSLAREAIRRGAFDLLEKPLDMGKLEAVLERALRLRSLESAPDETPSWTPVAAEQPLLGESPPMKNLFATLHRQARTDVNVLITGESGTGKELAANALHSLSPRATRQFVALNCGAIPRDLMESEIFGHVKGAFTGAVADREGAALRADGGTLFLDEICELPAELQTKLLRFLQTGVVTAVGGSRERKVDLRIVCATNRNLDEQIANGVFREDLYYRISEVTVRVPPLRERQGDCLLLAQFLLQQTAERYSRPVRSLAPDAIRALQAHRWPGNVRELENRIKGAVIMAETAVLTASDLGLRDPGEGEQSLGSLNLRAARQRAEAQALRQALAVARGNLTRAADLLGVTRPTLYDLLDRHGIDSAQFDAEHTRIVPQANSTT